MILFTQRILSSRAKSLQSYFREINKLELLTPDEEAELARKVREGDLQALERLTKANLRFVVSVAKQYQREDCSLSIEDLINEGNIGLIKAAQRFDERKGFKFISYAIWWIRQSIVKAIHEDARLVRIPINKIVQISKVGKAFIQLQQEFEREPSEQELAEMVHLERKELMNLKRLESLHLSLDANAGNAEGDDSMKVGDILVHNGQKPDALLKKESLKEDLGRVMSSLNERQRTVTKMYFGIGRSRPCNLEEIGKEMGLTMERVRQLKEIALQSLRKENRSALLKKYL